MPTKSNIQWAKSRPQIQWHAADFELGTYYYWLRTDNIVGACTVTAGLTTYSYTLGDDCEGLIFVRLDDNFLAYAITKDDSAEGATLTITPIKYVGTASVVTWTRSSYIRAVDQFTADLSIVSQYDQLEHGTGQAQYLSTISTIDRTRSTLLKIIECPYCPIDLNFTTEDILIVPDN